MPLLESWCVEEGQTGDEIVTALRREWASPQRRERGMLKGFVFPSAGAQGGPSRSDPQQNYTSERIPLLAENRGGYYPSLPRIDQQKTFSPVHSVAQ